MSEKSLINKCRICLQSDKELGMHCFFSIYVDESSLAQMFANITTFQVQENDGFPKKICTLCRTNIINFKKMISVFQETEELLKNEIYKETSKHENNDFADNKELISIEICSFDRLSDLENDYVDEDVHVKYEDNKINNVSKEGGNAYSAEDIKYTDMESINIHETKEIEQLTIVQPKKKHCTISSTGCGNLDYKYISSFKYTCQCGDCFLHKSGFRQHMQFRHSVLLEEGDFEEYSEEIKLKIPVGFPNNVEFVSSKATVRKKNLRCRICDTSFLTEEEVKTHEDIHKTYICDHCGAAFLKKNYLSDHLRIHSEERRYTCKTCQKTFKHRYTYSVHKRSHDITRNFVCDTCGASFKTRGTLRTHMRIKHSDIRNFQCPNCNLRFNLKSTLDKHFMRKHTPDRKKSFVCSKCGAAYLNKNTLTRHVAEKHLGMAKYFPCTICENKMYVMKKGLRAHMLKKHGIVYQ